MAKTLSSSTSNPYAAGAANRAAPTSLDVFSVQVRACAANEPQALPENGQASEINARKPACPEHVFGGRVSPCKVVDRLWQIEGRASSRPAQLHSSLQRLLHRPMQTSNLALRMTLFFADWQDNATSQQLP